MKRIFSSLLASILVLTLCVGCGSNNDQTGDTNDQDGTVEGGGSIFTTLTDLDMNETVLEVDGNGIPADLYLYWVMNKSYELEYQLNMFKLSYGMYGENVDEEGRIKWDQTLDGDPVADIVRQNAENNALSYALLENVAKAHDIELTAEDQAAIDELLAQQAEQSGGEEAFEQSLYEMGISKESHTRMVASQYLYQHLAELAGDPSSDIYQAPSDDDAYVDHILLATKDTTTNEPLPEEEAAAKKAQAEDLLSQLQASDDLEALFTELADTYGEDPGRESGAGYLIDPDTNFVQEFKDAAFALKPGEISGIVESDYGYHILMRKDLTEDHLASIAALGLSNYLDGQLAEMAENVERNEKLDAIDVKDFITSYREAVMALHPELNTEDDAQDGEDAGNAGDAGDAGNGEGDAGNGEGDAGNGEGDAGNGEGDAADGGDAPAEE